MVAMVASVAKNAVTVAVEVAVADVPTENALISPNDWRPAETQNVSTVVTAVSQVMETVDVTEDAPVVLLPATVAIMFRVTDPAMVMDSVTDSPTVMDRDLMDLVADLLLVTDVVSTAMEDVVDMVASMVRLDVGTVVVVIACSAEVSDMDVVAMAKTTNSAATAEVTVVADTVVTGDRASLATATNLVTAMEVIQSGEQLRGTNLRSPHHDLLLIVN